VAAKVLLVAISVACAFMWSRSYKYNDGGTTPAEHGEPALSFSSEAGSVLILLDLNSAEDHFRVYSVRIDERFEPQTWSARIGVKHPMFLGFAIWGHSFRHADSVDPEYLAHLKAQRPEMLQWYTRTTHWYWILLPYWLLILLTGSWPVWTLCRHFVRTRVLEVCHTCGYDLRASKDRCPECGTAIPAAAASVPTAGQAGRA
jgi:hypothetical protein